MLTYQSFTTPSRLLRKLIERFNVPSGRHMQEDTKTIKLKVCNAIKKWIEESPDDFKGNVLEMLCAFVDEEGTGPSAAIVRVLVKPIKQLRGTHKTLVKQRQNDATAEPEIPRNIFSDFTYLDLSDLEIARQLTVIDWGLYSAIKVCQ